MPYESSLFLDPDLRRQTRGSHHTLFTLACFLTLPALAVFFSLAVGLQYGFGSMPVREGALLVSAVLSSALGVLAWAALGLLLTKPAYPKWHAATWALVFAFAIVALPSSLFWMFLAPREPLLFWVISAVFAVASGSLVHGWRNLQLARQSLRRIRRLAMAA